MNMRKLIAVLAAVLMLCSVMPLAVSAAPGDVIIDKNFDDGFAFSNGSNENGYMVFDATTADWANVYFYANAIKSGTKYEISFDCKADKATNINVKINNNWAGDTFKWTTNVTTEWTTYTCVINPDELATLTSTALLMFTSNTTKANGAVYHIDNVVVKEYLDPATIGQITNGDFETGDLSGWEKHQSTVISTDAHTGSYAANLKGTGGWGGMLNQDIPVTAGKSYEISLWIKANANGANVQIKDGGTSGSNMASKWFNTTSWTQLTWTVIPTTEVICINFCGGGNGVAEDVLVDDITVTELKDPSFDGYITNGDFETGSTAPWTVYSGTAVSADAAKDGDYGLYIKNPTGGWGGTAYQNFTTEVGKTYVVMMDAKALSQGQNIQIKDNGTTKASKWFTGTSWTTLSFEYTAESTAGTINICGGGTGANEEIYVDNVFVFEKKAASNDGYIVNGDFETGTMEGLSPSQQTCVSRDAAKDGNFGLKMLGNGGWGGVGLWTITGLEAGATYKFEMDMNAIEQGFNWTLWQDSTSSGVKYASGYFSTKAWTTIEKEFVANSTTAVLNINGGGNGNAETVYLDNLKITLVKCATCDEAGCVDSTCSVCGSAISGTGEHNYVGEVTEDATCELTGTMTYTCSDCGDSYTEEIPAWHNGNLTHVPAVDAIDCANPGHIEYYTCPWCNEYFTDANASEMINPWFINITVDCVKPEGVADCANWTCETCGNENYGAGEHDTGVPACQNGHCSKCDQDIAGYGCANYDTPACGDGVCYYCGGFVAGLGHENGAWAPCQIGECSYGCGLTYPATAEHADEDADDYCDTCWNHLNHDVDPCVGGECSVCWTYIEGAHTYDDAFDVDCNVCGATRDVVAPVAKTGFSTSADVSGLAVRFNATLEGMGIDGTTAIYDNATLNGNKVVSMGAIVTNGVDTIDVPVVYLCDDDVSTSAQYAIRIKNIPADKYDVEITFTPYMIVEIDGVETTIYGEAQVGTYNQYAG